MFEKKKKLKVQWNNLKGLCRHYFKWESFWRETLIPIHKYQPVHLNNLYTCTTCTSVQPVHLYNLYICTTCTSEQPVHLNNLYTCTTCTPVQPVHLYNQYICTTCTSVQPVHLYNQYICTTYTDAYCTPLSKQNRWIRFILNEGHWKLRLLSL